MNARTAVPLRHNGYDELEYRGALQRLGLVPPIEQNDIHRAYRRRAMLMHPDRFAHDDVAREHATERIQELNAAKEYAMRNFRWFLADQLRSPRRNGSARSAQETTWQEWIALPVTAVYTLAMVFAAAPFLAVGSALGPARRAMWRASPLGRPAITVWRAWLFVGPHVVTAMMFVAVQEPVVRVWFGLSFLVMLATDVASLITGATNSLRSQKAILRLHHIVAQ
jgi:hypothetical protein